VLSQGGKVWKDKEKLGSIIATGLDLRKKFAIGGILIATPALIYLLQHHGASWLMTFLITVSLIPAFFTALSNTLLQVAPKLMQDIAPLQRNQVEMNTARLLMVLLTVFAFPFAFIAILSAGIPQIWSNRRLAKISNKYADAAQPIDPVARKEILAIVKKILPGAVYYCISGQISIWLISIFGSTANVAQVGALGRLTVVLTSFTTLFNTLIVPRFARLAEDKKTLIVRFLQIQGGLIVLSVFIVGTVILFPEQILAILGKNYSGLGIEIALMTGGSCVGMKVV
jgi:O-antigen/teichoic acid export membrane protein